MILMRILVLFLMATYITVNADHRSRWHRGDIRRFEFHDRASWRAGHWNHTRYSGRLGWWWVVGPSWYFYSEAVYPYPDPYIPSVIVVKSRETAPAPTPPVVNWYYCEASKEYYPYVASCPSGWKVVPATPAIDLKK
jgi:hypothetical protein